MITFRQKKFSLISDVLKGAAIGGNIGNLTGIFSRKYKEGNLGGGGGSPSPSDKETNKNVWGNQLMFIGGGVVIGAALGALVSGIKGLSNRINNRKTVDNRLMKTVIELLKKDNLKEGIDFTRDPK